MIIIISVDLDPSDIFLTRVPYQVLSLSLSLYIYVYIYIIYHIIFTCIHVRNHSKDWGGYFSEFTA